MSWETEDGAHEGYLVPQFFDGQLAFGLVDGSIPADRVASGAEVQSPDGTWTYPTRPAGEVTGWVIRCDCRGPDPDSHTKWIGPTFTRVTSPVLDDPRRLKVYAADEDVVFIIDDREEVAEAARDLWRSEHAFGAEALAEVKAAAAAVRIAKERLNTAAAMARHLGETWSAIGRVAEMPTTLLMSADERS